MIRGIAPALGLGGCYNTSHDVMLRSHESMFRSHAFTFTSENTGPNLTLHVGVGVLSDQTVSVPDLNLFSTDALVATCADHEMEVREQVTDSPI